MRVYPLCTHKEHIDTILDTIEFLTVNSKKVSLDFKQVALLIQCFVQEAATPYET